MDKLVTKIRKNLQAHELIASGDAVLVAVSGGVDSMVLLEALRQLSKHGGFTLTVAHYNHQLRGRASDLDEKLVRKYCEQHGLRFEVSRGDVLGLAMRMKISIEMAARELRHEFLADTAKRLKCSRVVLAHHADDQVELFFIRLFRGSGGEGLGGMAWQSASPVAAEVRLVRPLLNISKAELVAFAKRHEVAYREDHTNKDEDILRNRVRRKLLPFIKTQFGSGTVATIQRTMDVVAAEAEAVALEMSVWQASKKPTSFRKLPVAVQRRVIRRQLITLGVPESFDLIEELRQPTEAWVQVNPQTFLHCSATGVLASRLPQQMSFSETEVKVALLGSSGQVSLNARQIDWKLEPAPKIFHKPEKVIGLEVFDAEKVGSDILLRYWRPGDRFQPLGLDQSVKLQDWFVNRKIPAEKRRQLVVAETADGCIFWVEGERIGEQFKLDKASRRRLKWQWQAVKSPP